MGKIRLITGASGGIGGALTRRCLDAGDTVYAVSRRPLSGRVHEPRLIPVAADLTREQDIVALMERVANDGGPLDSLIHCAGVLHDGALGMAPEKRLEDLDAAAQERAFALNAVAPMLLAKHGLARLRHGERAVFASLSARLAASPTTTWAAGMPTGPARRPRTSFSRPSPWRRGGAPSA